jgi:hypothetical protein
MSAQVEQWRVSTVEGIFETDLDTLKQWILEGCVLPTDKVSKGKLNWIEAGRAPMLRAAFNGEINTAGTAPTVTTTGQAPQMPSASPPAEALDQVTSAFYPEGDSPGAAPETFESAPQSFIAPPVNVCHNHPEVSPKYVCRACATSFCAECPRFVSTSSIPVCPLCGDLCRLFEEERNKVRRQDFQSSGFGFKDFTRALRYPLEHKIALLFGAALYGFLQLAGFRGRVIAFVIMFGCISHVISQVAWGKFDRSFLPDFSAFCLLDDLVVPIVLGIGITIVTWGPMIVIALALFFGVINGPGLSPLGKPAAANVTQPTALGSENMKALMDPNADPKKIEEANDRLNQLRPGHQISEAAEQSKKELSDPAADLGFLMSYAQAPVLLLLLLLLSVAWAIFYYPMALSVAGYTEHFGSVVNPLVGLDTIRRMGGTYFKAFGMVLMIQIVGLVVSVIVALITAPFALPFFGNLPANFIDGSVAFYFNLVVACVLGLSLHKCADRLGIAAK